MDRKEFLSLVGISASSALIMSCVGCSKGSDNQSNQSSVNGPTGVDFTLDLSASANAALLSNGGYLATQGVLVAKTNAGAFIAVQQSCTHENYPLMYEGASQRFFCNNHGSAFSEKGVVLNSPANRNLTVYNTSVTGTTLKVYS